MSDTPLERRLKIALIAAHAEFCELEQFAGTAEVLRPIVRGQRVCRWDDPGWPELMAEVEAEFEEGDP